MKAASRILSIATLALAAGSIVSCAKTESVSDYPHEYAIEARQINPSHVLNQRTVAPAAIARIDVVINFESNSARLTPRAVAELQKVAALIKNPGFRGSHVTVQGYTDAVGKLARNLKLSETRSQNVINELATHGIPASFFTAQGLGSADPVATNKTAAGRAANRRVTFSVSVEQ